MPDWLWTNIFDVIIFFIGFYLGYQHKRIADKRKRKHKLGGVAF